MTIFGLLPPPTPDDPGLEHALDHIDRAIGVLLSEVRDKPRFVTLVGILVKPLQELEDVLWQLYTETRIDVAVGAQLDVLGAIVLEPRGGLADEDYRAIIRIKVRVLFSRGTGPNIIQIVQLFLETNGFAYTEYYPHAIQVTVTDSISTTRMQLLKRFLKKAKSAGVRIDLVDGSDPDMMIWSDPAHGWGSNWAGIV